MGDLDIIDQFMTSFTTYIDSGFGLLGGEVHFLTATLIAIDITLAGLFWAMGDEANVIGRFIKKVLYVGTFAFILNSFSALSTIIFNSFAQAGITAGGSTMSAADLLKPGKLAGTGFSAAWPLLQQANQFLGFTTFFQNVLTIAVLLLAWTIVVLAFFILAVQMFVTILEFKLTSLAGFILVPFALWNRTSFLAERVLGNVVSSGIKVMVLAIVVGIGSTYFTQFTAALNGQQPDIGQAMSLVLASLALLGLGIFAPGVAAGLVSGGPQLGAGSAIATSALAVGGLAAGGMAGAAAARTAGGAGLAAIRSGTAIGSAASTAYGLGQERSGSPTVAAGLGGVAAAAQSAASRKVSDALGLKEAAAKGQHAAHAAGAGPSHNTGGGGAPNDDMPAWARDLQSGQNARHHRQMAIHTLQSADRGGQGANPDIDERDE